MSTPDEDASVCGGWDTYVSAVMPPTAPLVQIVECRRAFYAGAAHLYGVVLRAADLPEAEAMARLDAYRVELAKFSADTMAEMLETGGNA